MIDLRYIYKIAASQCRLMSNDRISSRREFDLGFSVVSHGVRIGLEADNQTLFDKARREVDRAFGGKAEIFEGVPAIGKHTFGVAAGNGELHLYKDGARISSGKSERGFFSYLNSQLRLEVAEYAKGIIFIHAGVVGWNGQAIILPGKSFSGKSTLTAELVRNGAEYYSDEYAVIEQNGHVSPFPRHLSLRYFGATRERDVPPEELGGRIGDRPIPVGMVLFTKFQKGGEWQPEYLGAGSGIMEMLPNTLTLHRDPAFALKLLDLIARRAIMVKSPRGDVKKFAQFLLAFFDKNCKLAKMT